MLDSLIVFRRKRITHHPTKSPLVHLHRTAPLLPPSSPACGRKLLTMRIIVPNRIIFFQVTEKKVGELVMVGLKCLPTIGVWGLLSLEPQSASKRKGGDRKKGSSWLWSSVVEMKLPATLGQLCSLHLYSIGA